MIILGIETSCDETAIAVVEAEGDITDPKFKLLGSAINSQVELHQEYGGVYPTIAKREHIKNLPIVLAEALKKSGLGLPDIDTIAVTVGPGLEPALWTGITFAKELGERYNIPIIPTNHMEGHLASVLLHPSEGVRFPAVALLISGGHTELVVLKSWTLKKLIGMTKDDAVGEAFDKVARMMGLQYPGGPKISVLATKARSQNINLEIKFPRPMIHTDDYDFSFSGLKTSVLYYLRGITPSPTLPQRERGKESSSHLLGRGVRGEVKFSEELKMKVAREFEDACAEVLVSKSKKAIEEFAPKTFIIGGGVIANDKIREEFEHLINEINSKSSDDEKINLMIPEKSLTTDNAVMISIAGYFAHLTHSTSSGQAKYPLELKAQGNLKIS